MKENIHEIEFRRSLRIECELPSQNRLELLEIAKGSRYTVRLVAYQKDLREVADLHFDDGCLAREVPFASFRFVD